MRTVIILAALCAGVRADTVINGDRTILGRWDASGATATKPAKAGTALPELCDSGEAFFKTDGTANRQLYLCGSGNSWSPVGYASGTAAQLPASCTVGQIYFATDAAAGRNLHLCGAANQWTQMTAAALGAATLAGDNAFSGVLNASGASATLPAQVGTTLPETCSIGAMFFKSDAAAGRNLYLCTATPGTWTQLDGGGTATATFTTSGSEPGLPNARQWTNGAGTQINTNTAGQIRMDTNLTDRSYFGLREDWLSGNLTPGQMGSYGWNRIWGSSAGTTSYVTVDANHPGVLRCTTATADWCYVDLGITFAGLSATAGWDMQALVRLPDITSAVAEFGLASGAIYTGGACMLLRFDPSESANWRLKTCRDGTCGFADTGVPAVANTWHLLRLRMATAGTVLGSIDGGTEASRSANLPTVNLYLVHAIGAGAGVQRSLDIDFTAFQQPVIR